MHRYVVGTFIASSLLVCSTSCAVEPKDVGDDTGETTTETVTGDGDGDTGDGDGDTGDGDGDSGDGDGDTGDGDGDTGDGDGDANCAPGEPSVYVGYQDIDLGSYMPNVEIDWACTVTEANYLDGLYLLLDCPDADLPIEIDINATPNLSSTVVAGDTIRMYYAFDDPFWTNRHLRLDVEGYGHLLTLIDSETLSALELPFPIQPTYGLCTPTLTDCAKFERATMVFGGAADGIEMLDSNHMSTNGDPGIQIWIDTAGRYVDIECTDSPGTWYRILIIT
jgi:hypothetical protein